MPDDLCNGVPEIEKSATIWPTGHYNINSDYSRKSDKGIEYLYFDLCEAEREGLDIFGLEIIEGSLDKFLDHSTLVLKESAAKKFNLSAGDVICYGHEASDENTATVIAICKDPVSPSILDECDGWGGMFPQEEDNANNWNNPYYLVLSDGASPDAVCEKIRSALLESLRSQNVSEEDIAEPLKRVNPRLNPLTEALLLDGCSRCCACNRQQGHYIYAPCHCRAHHGHCTHKFREFLLCAHSCAHKDN